MREKQKHRKLNIKNTHKIWLSLSLILFGLVLSLLSRYIDGFADGYYTYVYRYLSVVFAFVFNLVPFSVAEISLYMLCLLLIGSILYGTLVIPRKKGQIKGYWAKVGCNGLLILSTIFFVFIIFCGINYQKTSFASKEGFNEKQYGVEELKEVCEYLTGKINEVGEKDISFTNLRQNSRVAMKELSKTYTSLTGYYPKPKYMLFAELLSYQQVSGVYSFYTVEANYNSDMPVYQQPFVMCHELAHLKGIMKEEEANFVAYLACRNSQNSAFQYSGAMTAYSYCMNELYSYDKDAYMEIRGKLCDRANQDIENKHVFWDKYEGTISNLQTKVNDAYLKANSQVLGASSYNEVVALIVNDYLRKK